MSPKFRCSAVRATDRILPVSERIAGGVSLFQRSWIPCAAATYFFTLFIWLGRKDLAPSHVAFLMNLMDSSTSGSRGGVSLDMYNSPPCRPYHVVFNGCRIANVRRDASSLFSIPNVADGAERCKKKVAIHVRMFHQRRNPRVAERANRRGRLEVARLYPRGIPFPGWHQPRGS